MATDPNNPYLPLQPTGQQQGVDSQQQAPQQPPAQKFNQFRGLQNTFNQAKGQGTQLAGAQTVQNAQNATTGAQNQANAGTTKQGAYIVGQAQDQENAGNVQAPTNNYTFTPTQQGTLQPILEQLQQQGSTLTPGTNPHNFAAEPDANSVGGGVSTDQLIAAKQAKESQIPTQAEIDAAKAAAYNQAGVAQQDINKQAADAGTAAQNWATDATGKLAQTNSDISTMLASQPTQGLANAGTQSALENQSANLNQVLNQSPNTSNLGALSALFGQNYDASRYGGLDSQIYGNQVQQMRQQAAQNQQGTQLANQGQQAAIKEYLGDISGAQTGLNNWDTTQGNNINTDLTGTQAAIEAARQDAIGKRPDLDTESNEIQKLVGSNFQGLENLYNPEIAQSAGAADRSNAYKAQYAAQQKAKADAAAAFMNEKFDGTVSNSAGAADTPVDKNNIPVYRPRI